MLRGRGFPPKIKAKTEALYIAEVRVEAKAKAITQMAKAAIKSNAKVYDEGIERMRAGSEARENVKA